MKKWGILAAAVLMLNLILPVSASQRPEIRLREVTASLHADKTLSVSEHLLIDGRGTEETSLYTHMDNNALHQIEDLEILSEDALVFAEGDMIRIAEGKLNDVTLNYTVRFFADEDPEWESVSYDFGESLFSLNTEKLQFSLTLDPGLETENWKLSCDGSSREGCRYGEGDWSGQTFTFRNTESLQYSRIELQMSFDQSQFEEIPVYEWPVHFDYRYMDVTLDKNRNMHVIQQFRLNRSEEDRLSLDLYPGWPGFPESVLENVVFSDPAMEVSRYGYVDLPSTRPLEMKVEYDIIARKQKPSVRIDFRQFSREGSVDDLRFHIHLPQAYPYDLNCYDTVSFEDAGEIRVQVNEEGTDFLISNTAPVRGNVNLSLDLDVPVNRNLLSYAGMSMFFQLLAVGLAVVAVLFRSLSHVRISRETGDLPDQVNPMTAALLQGKKVLPEQLAAVIMNWVAQGCVRITHNNGQVQMLYLETPYGPGWETEFMNDLFALGDGARVDLNTISLKGHNVIVKAMDQAEQQVQHEYRNKGLKLISAGLLLFSVLPALVCTLLAYPMTYEPKPALILSLLLTVWTVVYGMIKRHRKKGHSKTGIMIAGGFFWFILFTLTLTEFMDFEGGLALCYLGMLTVHCLVDQDLTLTREGMRNKRSCDLWKKDFRRMSRDRLDDCLSYDRDYALKSYSYAWMMDCGRKWEDHFSRRLLPDVPSVIDENGVYEKIWILDELREQLILCCKAR